MPPDQLGRILGPAASALSRLLPELAPEAQPPGSAGETPPKAQLRAILGADPAPGVADVVFGRSGGNAYLVEELAGVVRAGGDPAGLPPSLRDVLLSRVDTLSADAQRLLRTASVAGRTAPDRL